MQLKIVPDVIASKDFSHIDFKATIREAAQYMRERRMSAVPITRGDGSLRGILTDRDVTYRVVAPGLSPDTTHLLNVTTREPETISSDATVPVALHKMHLGRYRHLPILDGDSLWGLVSISDLYACAYDELLDQLTGREIREFLDKTIIPHVITEQEVTPFSADTTVREAAQFMADRHVGSVLIVTDGELEGIFTEADVVNRVVARGMDPEETKLSAVMTREPESVAPDDTCKVVLERMCRGRYRHLPVVDYRGVRGIASVRDVFAVLQPRIEKEFGRSSAWWTGLKELLEE